MNYVDTNIFLRFLTGDDPAKTGPCTDLFRRIERREEEAATSEATVAEVVYVLTSPKWYGRDAADVTERLSPLVRLPSLRLPNRQACLRALDLFGGYRRLDFPGALAIAHFEIDHLDGIYSYDRGLDRVPGVVRVEP